MSVRILILEDDPLIALDLQSIVEGEGHEVVGICGSLAQARRSIEERPDFALLDIEVADGKSYEFASELAARGVPFVFVSASRHSDVPDHLRQATFVPKPYRQSAILRSLPRRH